MSYVICKTVEFEAAHLLTKVEPGHQCGQLHGHSYVVEVEMCSAALDDDDWLLDFGLISQLIKGRYDHKFLNELPEFQRRQPTAEALTRAIVERIDFELLRDLNNGADDPITLTRVRVSETRSSWAEWRA